MRRKECWGNSHWPPSLDSHLGHLCSPSEYLIQVPAPFFWSFSWGCPPREAAVKAQVLGSLPPPLETRWSFWPWLPPASDLVVLVFGEMEDLFLSVSVNVSLHFQWHENKSTWKAMSGGKVTQRVPCRAGEGGVGSSESLVAVAVTALTLT